MDEVGRLLREAREARGVTLEQAQDDLKIQRKFLSALEEGRYHVLPTPVHVRGYLRNYARYLALDPQPLLDGYQSVRYNIPADAQSAHASGGNPFFNPVNVELNPDRSQYNNDSLLRILIIIALLVAIGLVASRFFVDDGREFNLGDVYQAVVSGNQEPQAAEIDTERILQEAQPTPENNLLIETQRGELEEATLPTPVPTLRPLLALEVINAEIETTERVFVQVYVDGELVVQNNIPAGERLDFRAEESLRINTGNGFALVLTINDVELGRLGERNQIVDISWQTTDG